jgi:hypothetical protein
LNWLIGLYETGINGILADEMVSCELYLIALGFGQNYLDDLFLGLFKRVQIDKQLLLSYCPKNGDT